MFCVVDVGAIFGPVTVVTNGPQWRMPHLGRVCVWQARIIIVE